MKVLLINGSPKAQGCTFTALSEVAKELNKANIETEIFHVGNKPIRGCMACGGCNNTDGKCVFNDDTVNIALEKAKDADGFIFGSPVHYAAASGQITAFLDRFFYAGEGFQHKPGAAIVSCRRGGSTAAFEQLNKYFTISNMPVVSSQYWNMVHGNTPEEVKQDLEGMQTMRILGKNMAWLLKCIQAGKDAGINIPEKEEQRAITNFIR
ncbi:FMN reductase [Clostridium zeae]|uniref:FMN reductase n=1 Tax=Clostridium zeae TaxID=2759022 RepID=A0ABQ1EAB8_9CLOT|nr:flavodoxin family protein [Clostridium zeae]GFZ31733.1 FMN reductase [Clostridium zeae]